MGERRGRNKREERASHTDATLGLAKPRAGSGHVDDSFAIRIVECKLSYLLT